VPAAIVGDELLGTDELVMMLGNLVGNVAALRLEG